MRELNVPMVRLRVWINTMLALQYATPLSTIALALNF